MTERYTYDIILCRLDGSRERIPRDRSHMLDPVNHYESFNQDGSWFDYIGTQDGESNL